MKELEFDFYTDYDVLDTREFHKGGFRLIVRDRKILTRLAEYIDAVLGREGFECSEIHRPVGFYYGMIVVSYISRDCPIDELPKREIRRLSQRLDSVCFEFYRHWYPVYVLQGYTQMPPQYVITINMVDPLQVLSDPQLEPQEP